MKVSKSYGVKADAVLMDILDRRVAAMKDKPGTESAFSVPGKILTSDSQPPPSCVLQVYRKQRDRLVGTLDVPQQFERQVVIAPGVQEYYMVVSCPGNPKKVTTGVYKLGSRYYLYYS